MKYFYALLNSVLLFALLIIMQPVHAVNGSASQESADFHTLPAEIKRMPPLTVPVIRNGIKSLGYVPQVSIFTPSYPIGIGSSETRLVPYHLDEMGNVSGEITSRTLQFYTQYDAPLSERMGPYKTQIKVKALQSTDWNELVYLPESVVSKARSMGEYAIVLKTTFRGRSPSGAAFDGQASLLLLLPPKAFNKDIPADKAVDQSTSPLLQWHSSVGAIDYEYCYDAVDNNSCDTNWTGTYWLSTIDTNAAPKDLPSGTTFYWQVRANNTAGTTYADESTWWSFTTACNTSLITVANVSDSGPGSLRQAIADICPGGTIDFDPSLSGQTVTLNSTLFLYKDVNIDGSALESKIGVSGNNTVTVFEIATGMNVKLDSLSITNGRAVEEDGGIAGGGVKNHGTLNITNSVISNNTADISAQGNGGGIYNSGSLNISASSISSNSAYYGGGILNINEPLNIEDTTISDNTAIEGGGIYNNATLALVNSTVSDNTADRGGGVISTGAVDISNSTLAGNSAGEFGGGIYSAAGPLTVINSTFSDNSSATGGGGIHNGGTLNLTNTILANSTSGSDCFNEIANGTIGVNVNNLIELNAAAPNQCGTPASTSDPGLGLLANNGGITQTMALLSGSPAINAGSDTNCPDTDQRGISRPQGIHCDIGAYEVEGIEVSIGNAVNDSYVLAAGESMRRRFVNVNTGPVIINDTINNIIASQRVIYGGGSYSEMMGLPAEQLSKEYLFPYYNNVAMNSQLRVSNLGDEPTTITVYLGKKQLDSYQLAAGAVKRKSYDGQNKGPLRVTSSTTNILATVRVLYLGRSYSELMGYPLEQLSREYWYPVYDNINVNSQLRVSNVGDGPTTISIYLAGKLRETVELPAGRAYRTNYNKDKGPLQVVSDRELILSTIRLLFKGKSFSEVTGISVEQLSQEAWYPVYDNVNLRSELRVANVGTGDTVIIVYAGGTEIDSFPLVAGMELRRSYAEYTGPLRVVSSTEPIVSSVRMQYKTSAFNSLYEIMGLPGGQLSNQYFFPWYNNTAMKSELRFAVP